MPINHGFSVTLQNKITFFPLEDPQKAANHSIKILTKLLVSCQKPGNKVTVILELFKDCPTKYERLGFFTTELILSLNRFYDLICWFWNIPIYTRTFLYVVDFKETPEGKHLIVSTQTLPGLPTNPDYLIVQKYNYQMCMYIE